MLNTITTLVCADCASVIVNNDDSGMMPIDAARVRSAIAALPYRVDIDTSGFYDFDTRPCGVCDTTLAGYRYDAELVTA